MISLSDDIKAVRCAVCKRRVEHAEASIDYNTDRAFFEFHCHGAVERVWLDQEEIEDNRITLGEAFAQKLLPPPVLALEAGDG